MSARSHHRVTPGWPGSTPPARPATRPIFTPSVCDYCAGSMTGQEFRGDKCLDCRVRDGEAEVDENGEEIVDDDACPVCFESGANPCRIEGGITEARHVGREAPRG